MEYRKSGELHLLEFDKDELITLIALVHEGLENIEAKSLTGDQLAGLKNESAKGFVSELNKKIMTT